MQFRYFFLIKIIVAANVAANASGTSTNYQNLIHNPDATVAIVEPQFEFSKVNFSISRSSDLDGICFLYGYTRSQKQIVTYSEDEDAAKTSVVIGQDGKLTQLNSGDFPISALVCDDIDNHKRVVNTEAKNISENNDGSFTLFVPRFSGLKIGHGSNLDGVCRLFGFRQAKEDKLDDLTLEKSSEAADSTVSIGDDGRIFKMNSGFYPIRTLVCEK